MRRIQYGLFFIFLQINLSLLLGHWNRRNAGTMTLDDLKDILASNPDMLERYVMEVISLETLEKWHQRKAEKLGKS